MATVHSELSLTYTIESTDTPVNCYRNQIIIEEGMVDSQSIKIMFGQKTRHFIYFADRENLIEKVCDAVNKDVVNAINCDLPTLAFIQNKLVETFPSTKFCHSTKLVIDVYDKNEQKEIIVAEHGRAHRAVHENVKQILQDYFFPKMTRLAKEIVANCRICNKAKYDRHPQKQCIGKTPIPNQVGEILHIDIYSTFGKFFLTCIDKFSKFAIVQPIA